MRFKFAILCYFVTLVAMSFVGGVAHADYGPLQSSNRFPLHLMFLKPRPVKADLPHVGDVEASVAVAYSNTYFNQGNRDWDVLIDMEMAVVDLSVVYGVMPKLALKIDLPVVSMSDGIFDGFLGNYHDFIGVENYDREDRPSDTFGYQVSKDGALWLKGQSGAYQLADATISVQYALAGSDVDSRLASSLLLSVKVPLGDETHGLSSGAFDVGLYWPSQWNRNRWSFFLMPSLAFIGDPQTQGADVDARNSYGLFAGVAYDYTEQLALLAQLNYYSSPIEQTGISELDDGSLTLDLGFHYRVTQSWIVEFVFGEDLTLAAPDFNLRLGMRWKIRTRSSHEQSPLEGED